MGLIFIGTKKAPPFSDRAEELKMTTEFNYDPKENKF